MISHGIDLVLFTISDVHVCENLYFMFSCLLFHACNKSSSPLLPPLHCAFDRALLPPPHCAVDRYSLLSIAQSIVTPSSPMRSRSLLPHPQCANDRYSLLPIAGSIVTPSAPLQGRFYSLLSTMRSIVAAGFLDECVAYLRMTFENKL